MIKFRFFEIHPENIYNFKVEIYTKSEKLNFLSIRKSLLIANIHHGVKYFQSRIGFDNDIRLTWILIDKYT